MNRFPQKRKRKSVVLVDNKKQEDHFSGLYEMIQLRMIKSLFYGEAL